MVSNNAHRLGGQFLFQSSWFKNYFETVSHSVDQAGLDFKSAASASQCTTMPAMGLFLNTIIILALQQVEHPQVEWWARDGTGQPSGKAPSLASESSWEEQRVHQREARAASLWFRPLHHHLVQMPRKSSTVCKGEHTPHTEPSVGHNLRPPLVVPHGMDTQAAELYPTK